MKVLIVCSSNSGKISPFINEQAEAISQLGVDIDFFKIKGRGTFGYLKNLRNLILIVKIFKPDIIHAHYGLSGFLANLQRQVPVITTFHGSDVNAGGKYWLISKVAALLSVYNIFVSQKLAKKLFVNKNFEIIPCGLNDSLFTPLNFIESRNKLFFLPQKKYILFSSSFNRPEKNYNLAKKAIGQIKDFNIELIELKNKSREEVLLLLNSVDLFLMTSLNEGSPQTIKEAMACNCPIVSTDVGDVKEVMAGTYGCYLTSFCPEDVADKIKTVLSFNRRTNGYDNFRNSGLDSISSAKKIVSLYNKILTKE